jgi:hypothetical protein
MAAQIPKKVADLIRPDAPAADARTALGLGSVATHAAADFATPTDLATKANAADLAAHVGSTTNPHNVTAAQVGAYTTAQADALLAGKAAVSTPGADLWLVGGTLRRRYAQPGAAGLAWFTSIVAPDPTTGLPTVYNSDGTVFDVSQLTPTNTGQTYYVGYPGASDTKDGLTTGTSFGSLAKAVAMADVGKVIIKYPYFLHRSLVASSAGSPMKRDLIIQSDTPGSAIISSCYETTLTVAGNWIATAGQANVWQATPTAGVRTAIVSAWDAKTPDANGDFVRLLLQTSVAAVTATPGSYYVDATNIYVHTSDNRQPDGNIRVMLNQYNLYLVSNGYTLYLQDIAFEGGLTAFQVLDSGAGNRPRVIARNCTFKYASDAAAGNGASMQGCISHFQNCTAAQNALDGFNYHSHNGLLCQSVEIGCIGRANGWNGGATDSQNGSTTHDGNTIVRVAGSYFGNYGPNLADVTAGTTSWNVGCGAWGSTATTAAAQNCNYQSQCTGAGGLWLDTCWGHTDPASAAKYQLVVPTAGAKLSFRSFSGGMNFLTVAGATLAAY